MSKYQFEVFCIEPQDIKTEDALQSALSFSAQLWEEHSPDTSEKDGIKRVRQKELGVSIKIIPV